nr:OHCU decarboxylase [Acinetobacter sp.]
SDREQATLNSDQETLDAIYQGNLAYEKKYGFIFLIKASGLNSQQILTALNYRLKNDPDIEKRIVHQQLLEIALLRLKQEVEA